MKAITRGWGVHWRSGPNNVDHKRSEYLVRPVTTLNHQARQPLCFTTRAEARIWVREHYSYIAARRDLREYPHDWKVPRVVRVTVTTETVK